ncbi:MAG: S9 family peptidase [Vicinamibacterales bacterium]
MRRTTIRFAPSGAASLLAACVAVTTIVPARVTGDEPRSIARLFSRPYLWGTIPANVTWAANSRVVVFSWNAAGQSFRDLYAVEPAGRAVKRLTDMEAVREPFSESDAERDPRLGQFLMPPSGITDFDVSPDGATVVFVHRGDLYSVASAGGSPPQQLTRTKSPEATPRFSPDGRTMAFTRDNDVFVRTQAGTERQLTSTGGPDRQNGTGTAGANFVRPLQWSPDSRRLGVLSINLKDVASLQIPNYSGARVTSRTQRRSNAGGGVPLTTLLAVDAEGSAPPMVLGETDSTWSVMNWAWAPDSAHVAIVRLSRSRRDREVLVAEAGSGRTTTVFGDHDDRWISPMTATLDWAPDGATILTSTERAFNHLIAVPASGGTPRPLTEGAFEVNYWRSGRMPQWHAASNRIVFHSTEAGSAERHAYTVSPDGGPRTKLFAWEGLDETQISPDGRYLAVLHANLDEPGDLYIAEAGHTDRPTRVTHSPLEGFEAYPWIRPQFVQFPSRADGKAITARLLLPPGTPPPGAARPRAARGNARLPAVVFVHGAGYAQSGLHQWGAYNQVLQVFNDFLARQGFVVLDLDYRGSSGYGRDWRSDVYLHLGGLDLQDELSGVDYLSSLGFVDTDRIGIWGLSYGGFMTNMALLTAPTVFRAGVSWAPVNDWANYDWSYTEERLTTPSENPAAYERSGPLHFASRLERPLLMIHGMGDDNVHFQDTVQLVESLVAAGKSFDVMFYPQENHVFARQDSLIDAFTRTAAFFSEHLRGRHEEARRP